MSFKGLEIVKSEDIVSDVECPLVPKDLNGGKKFIVQLSPVSESEFREMRKRYKRKKWNKRTHQEETEIDDSKWNPDFNRRAIKGWKNLTISGLKELVLVKIDEELRKQWKKEVVYSDELVDFLMEECPEFYLFIIEGVRDVSNFRDKVEAEVGENFISMSGQKPKNGEGS